MTNKILWVILLLCLLTPLLAAAQTPAPPQNQTPAATATTIAPTTPPKPHPWWDLTEENARKYFNMGIEDARQGKKEDAFPINMMSCKAFDKPITIDKDLGLWGLFFIPPLAEIYVAGFNAEHDLLSDEQKETAFRQVMNLGLEKKANFLIYLVDSKIYTHDANFAIETDTGYRIAPNKKMAHPDIPPDILERKDILLKGFILDFPVTNKQGEPAITQQTKWIRFWTITDQARLPVTFWLDGSNKVEVGKIQ